MDSARQRILKFIFFACAANFLVFWIGAVLLGGDAFSGGVRHGHYFLSSHGRRTEVSRSIFVYSECQTISVFITHPLGLICGLLWSREKKKYAKDAPNKTTTAV